MFSPLVTTAYAFDRALAALFLGATQGETISQAAAIARIKNRRWGCVLCTILATLVEPDHCASSIDVSGPTSPKAAFRAGVGLLGVAISLTALCWAGWEALFFAINCI